VRGGRTYLVLHGTLVESGGSIGRDVLVSGAVYVFEIYILLIIIVNGIHL